LAPLNEATYQALPPETIRECVAWGSSTSDRESYEATCQQIATQNDDRAEDPLCRHVYVGAAHQPETPGQSLHDNQRSQGAKRAVGERGITGEP